MNEIISYTFNDIFLIKEITSDSSGLITIEEIDGYRYFNSVAFNNNQPANIIRFGDNIYVGYYGGTSTPNTSEAITLMFTPLINHIVYVYYIKN